MSDANTTVEAPKATSPSNEKAKAANKPKWETPKLEDVSEQVMAQPYIRFT
jgi:hypothetical protein